MAYTPSTIMTRPDRTPSAKLPCNGGNPAEARAPPAHPPTGAGVAAGVQADRGCGCYRRRPRRICPPPSSSRLAPVGRLHPGGATSPSASSQPIPYRNIHPCRCARRRHRRGAPGSLHDPHQPRSCDRRSTRCGLSAGFEVGAATFFDCDSATLCGGVGPRCSCCSSQFQPRRTVSQDSRSGGSRGVLVRVRHPNRRTRWKSEPT